MEIKQYEERLQELWGLRACTQTPARARGPGEQKEDADGVRKELSKVPAAHDGVEEADPPQLQWGN